MSKWIKKKQSKNNGYDRREVNIASILDYDRLSELLKLDRVQYGPDGVWLRACCPLHRESRASFGINTQEGYFKCYVCGGGSLDDLVSRVFNITFDDAREWLGDNCSPDPEALLQWLASLRLRKNIQLERKFSEAQLLLFKTKTVKPYKTLLERGFTYQVLEQLEAGYDRISKRITFPVRNTKGELVGVLGRAVKDDAVTRWKVYWKFAKRLHLYNGNNLVLGKPLLVTEGSLDVARAIQFGFENTSGLMGAHPSNVQLDLIRDLNPQYIINAMDNDFAGQKGGRVLLDSLLDEFPIFNFKWPENKNDLGALSGNEFDYGIKHKKDPILVKFKLLSKNLSYDIL